MAKKPEPGPKNWRWLMKFAEKFERRTHELNLSFSKVRERMVQAWEQEGGMNGDERMPATTTTLARWRRCESAPDLFDLRLLARALEVPISYLADETLTNVSDTPGIGDEKARRVLEIARRVGLEEAATILTVCAPYDPWEVAMRMRKPDDDRQHVAGKPGPSKEKPPQGSGGSPGHGGKPPRRG